MKIINIETTKVVLKTKKEREKELKNCENGLQNLPIWDKKRVPLKEPIYIVEMTNEEYQIVSFYLELERRKPIVNMKIGDKEDE